jgi:hypothetical protein
MLPNEPLQAMLVYHWSCQKIAISVSELLWESLFQQPYERSMWIVENLKQYDSEPQTIVVFCGMKDHVRYQVRSF